MSRILQIIYIGIRGLLDRKTLYFLLFLFILVIAAVGTQLYSISTQVGNSESLLAQKADLLVQIMEIWGNFTIIFAIIFSASSVYTDLNSKNIYGVLSKPLSRAEYLVGRWLAVALFFTIFILFGTAIILFFLVLWGIPATFLFVTGIIHHIAIVFVYSAISFTLSLFLPAVMGGGITFLLYLFRGQFEMLLEMSNIWAKGLGYFLFYGSPAIIEENLIRHGILENLLQPEYILYWKVILENVFYSAIVIFVGIILFRRKDILLD